MENYDFCTSLFNYKRFVTREVTIGNCAMGGNNPIRVQSMTTTNTLNTAATIKQTIQLIEAGCDYVRITAPSIKEAQNLAIIKKEINAAGFTTPLIADIHFTPNAAELAARLIEKVRVNPGNYADKKKFDILEYTDLEYDNEIQRIRERFIPLVKICKEYGTAMRIGTNHGSLSDRILSRYGDTPHGMVESAFEFLRICEDENYHNIVLSMKASNPKIMMQAYRLLVNQMMATNRNYPIHLGVTEAGDGEDGRIKSAAGIGALLEDGIGDTIRVSLTEDPVLELPVARKLAERYTNRAKEQNSIAPREVINYTPFEYNKRKTLAINGIGNTNVPRVIADFSTKETISQASLFAVGYNYSVTLDKYNITDQACDYIYIGNKTIDFEIPGTLSIIQDNDVWQVNKDKTRHYPLFNANVITAKTVLHPQLNFVQCTLLNFENKDFISLLKNSNNIVLVTNTSNTNAVAELRAVFFTLNNCNLTLPVIINRNYTVDAETTQLHSATDCASLLLDGFSDGVWLSAPSVPLIELNKIAFGILQATRTRISKTEYISCPSCGRTLFDLQETTQKIRERTHHLKGIKIGIMGCIVNGPGEMADADYGYVGAGVDKISLYKGREVVQKNIHPNQAVDALINLIKQHNDWVEMPQP
ncbi:MAG: (E)-4-hydroxy-3-methylbut-2-enyl-diphosphate synthase [Bacteroidia bacterium]|nr:(E)-4-hydroxy-3-methylbut-2-enyl-diphosphate synthase [Bacteroidia bacterium]